MKQFQSIVTKKQSRYDICNLETGYAPPFASAMDALNNAGNALDNILAGLNVPIDAHDFLTDFRNGKVLVVDFRGKKEATPFLVKYGKQWLNIPQEELRSRYNEIPREKSVYLICDTGPRSYESQVFLCSKGYSRTKNIQGGYAMVKMIDQNFI